MAARCTTRRGVTLVETLVIVAILGLLLALLLPAIAQAREAVRGLQCRNNLRQLALAIHGYHDAFSVLPPSEMMLGPAYGPHRKPTDAGWGWNASWMVLGLPYLEQRELFNAWNFKRDASDPSNKTVSRTTVSTFLCPSESRGQPQLPPFAPTSYHGNRGGPGVIANWNGTIVPLYTSYPEEWWGPDPNLGVFGLQAIGDGTTMTALISEKIRGIPLVDTGRIRATDRERAVRAIFPIAFGSGLVANRGDHALAHQGLNACRNLPPDADIPSTIEGSWIVGAIWAWAYPWHVANSEYTHFNTPNGYSCYNTAETHYGTSHHWPGGVSSLITATSHHPGGVNVAFSDASVRFIRDQIQPETWWALGSRNGGEVISSDGW
jgi:type II secretory pathway pseudopilin PulG